MTSPFADNVLCAVTANESGQTTIFGFGDCNFQSVTLVTLCTFKKVKQKKCKKIEKKRQKQIYMTKSLN